MMMDLVGMQGAGISGFVRCETAGMDGYFGMARMVGEDRRARYGEWEGLAMMDAFLCDVIRSRA